jgi:hypothetical protein
MPRNGAGNSCLVAAFAAYLRQCRYCQRQLCLCEQGAALSDAVKW